MLSSSGNDDLPYPLKSNLNVVACVVTQFKDVMLRSNMADNFEDSRCSLEVPLNPLFWTDLSTDLTKIFEHFLEERR
jgi:hypothetical protein